MCFSPDDVDMDTAAPEFMEMLRKWLSSLPHPIGVMACFDSIGKRILDACRELGISVPEQVAVIGVDNDRVFCGLASTPMSSIVPDSNKAGYLAAELLDRCMSGETPAPSGAHYLKPVRVVTRRSTDVVAVEDPEIAPNIEFHSREMRDLELM